MHTCLVLGWNGWLDWNTMVNKILSRARSSWTLHPSYVFVYSLGKSTIWLSLRILATYLLDLLTGGSLAKLRADLLEIGWGSNISSPCQFPTAGESSNIFFQESWESRDLLRIWFPKCSSHRLLGGLSSSCAGLAETWTADAENLGCTGWEIGTTLVQNIQTSNLPSATSALPAPATHPNSRRPNLPQETPGCGERFQSCDPAVAGDLRYPRDLVISSFSGKNITCRGIRQAEGIHDDLPNMPWLPGNWRSMLNLKAHAIHHS